MILSLFQTILVQVSARAADFNDTTPPRVTIEEVSGLNPNLNIVLFKIQAEDIANKLSLRDCNAGSTPPNCRREGNYAFLSLSQSPPSNLAPACTSENLTKRQLGSVLLATNELSVTSSNLYKFGSIFYVAVAKSPFEKIPDGCPQWRNDSLQTISKDGRYAKLTVIDDAGNSTEVPIWTALQNAATLPTSTQGMCFLDSNTLGLSRALTNMSNQYERFRIRFANNPQFSNYTKNTVLEKYEDQLKNAEQYAKFFQESFELSKLNSLPTCKTGTFASGADAAVAAADIANVIAELSDKLAVIAEAENQKKAEAEAKAKAEAEAKAKSEAEAKAKAEAEAKVKAEAAKKRTTITCVKGKITKKVTAVNPKCPAGYKKK